MNRIVIANGYSVGRPGTRCWRSEGRGQRTIRRLRRLHGLGKKVCFKRVALPSEFTRHVGNQDYLRGIYGLTVDGIVENTIALLKNGC